MLSFFDSLSRAARQYLKRYDFVVRIKRKFWPPVEIGLESTPLNVINTFPLYAPNSGGDYKDIADITIRSINQTIPLLTSLARLSTGKNIKLTAMQAFPTTREELQAADQLKKYLDKYGSDKANLHNYHKIYGRVLKSRDRIRGILEIGLGTDNPDVVSNMGPTGLPGASLRAFRDFLPNAQVYGADVDRGILFQEERIKTYYVDQTDDRSFDVLGKSIPSGLDLVIDDGLHSPDANIRTLLFALSKIKTDGWIIIEDISARAVAVWELVGALLPANYTSHLMTAAGFMRTGDGFVEDTSVVFAVHRIA